MSARRAAVRPLAVEMHKALVGQHPVVTGRYRLSSPPIERAWALVVNMIRYHHPSMALMSDPRWGKTACSEEIEARLARDYPEFFVVWFDAQYYKEKVPSEKRFLGDLLIACEHSLTSSGDPEKRILRIANYLWSKVERTQARTIVILVDEAQDMRLSQWRLLKRILNKLERRRVQTHTVCFGQRSLLINRNAFYAADGRDVVMRFMATVNLFEGIASVKELASVLRQYDTALIFPEESGVCFTEFMYPHAFGAGFRLEQVAERLWAAFKAAYGPRHAPLIIGMHWLIRAINALLMDFAGEDFAGWQPSRPALTFAVTVSNFQESVALIEDTPR